MEFKSELVDAFVDSYPLLYINELPSRLQGTKYFSSLDLHDKYFHLPIAD